MSACEETQLMLPFDGRLGIIAGGGDVPKHLIAACKSQNIDLFVVALEGQADANTVQGVPHIYSRPGAAGAIIKAFKAERVSNLVLIGTLRRPSFKELQPDLKAAEFFATAGFKAIGDDGLLTALRGWLEKEGFTLHGAHRFMPDFLLPEGSLGRVKPDKKQLADIARGVEVVQALGALDIGQAAVVQQGHVLGVEGAEGTDALIQRCATLQRKGSGAVLVKLCKPDQDRDLDLPTIGLKTLEYVIEAGFAGIAGHAGQSFILDKAAIKTLANKNKVFVSGIKA